MDINTLCKSHLRDMVKWSLDHHSLTQYIYNKHINDSIYHFHWFLNFVSNSPGLFDKPTEMQILFILSEYVQFFQACFNPSIVKLQSVKTWIIGQEIKLDHRWLTVRKRKRGRIAEKNDQLPFLITSPGLTDQSCSCSVRVAAIKKLWRANYAMVQANMSVQLLI